MEKKLENDKKFAVNLLMIFSSIIGGIFFMFSVSIFFNLGTFNLASFITLLSSFVSFLSVYLAFKKKYNFSKFIIVLFPPYALTITSVIVKINFPEFNNVYTYLTPKIFCIIYLMAPIIFFGVRQKKKLILSFILLSPTVLLFDYFHQKFGIVIGQIPYVHHFYPLFVGMILLFYFLALASLLFFQKGNIIFRKKIEQQKQVIEDDKKELAFLVQQNNLITANIKDFVWMFDLEMKVNYVSPSCYDFTGYTKEELMQIDFSVLHSLNSYQKIKHLISTALKNNTTGNETVTEIEYIKKDGTVFIAEVIGKSIFDEYGKKNAIVGVSRDITIRKEQEQIVLFQSNLYKILDITSQNKKLPFVLQEVLEQLLNLKDLNIQQKGLIFLTNDEGELEIAAHKNVEVLAEMCSTIKKGQCLCGIVLEQKEKLFCNSVGHTHTIVPPGMKPHGHYVVPIKKNDEVLGVINIYIKQGVKKDEKIEQFLEAVADVLAKRIIAEKAKEKIKLDSIIIKQKEKQLRSTLKELNESISYAEFLQRSLIPNQDTINRFFKESSVLFLPKDKVSGDFYFAHQIDDNLYFGVGDCTGHGIPGSFLAAMSIEAVKYIVETSNGQTPEKLLNNLRDVAKNRFSINLQDKRTDSMDAAMCMYNLKTDELYYSGGFMNLFIVRNNTEIIEYKATKCPIGSYPVEKDFELQYLDLIEGDVLYIASDGYVDQFGIDKSGDKTKPTKFKRKRFKELLIKISHLPSDEQVKELEKTLIDWRGDIDQIDDVTIFIAKH